MRKIACFVACVLLFLCVLFACGVVPYGEASAPMAQDAGLVRATLTALPEELDSIQLLARTSSIVLSASNGGSVSIYEYRPASGAYRRMIPPIEGTWETVTMAAAPDGCLWTVLRSEDGCVLLKSSQGSVLLQQDLENFVPETMICDSAGHVFAAAERTVRCYSSEGVLQGTLVLPNQSGSPALRLAAKQDRVFLRTQKTGECGVYLEILPDMTLGSRFDACVSSSDVGPIGSFLEDYLVMEADSVGLYAYRENSGWETVCLWAEQHLDGVVDKHLISDAQGNGVVRYEKNSQVYCLNLSPA